MKPPAIAGTNRLREQSQPEILAGPVGRPAAAGIALPGTEKIAR
jgi:hypothetical protein